MKTIQDLLTDYAGEITTQKVKKRSSRRYSSKFKKAALRLLRRKGSKINEIAAALDISTPTLKRWSDSADGSPVAIKKPRKAVVINKLNVKSAKKVKSTVVKTCMASANNKNRYRAKLLDKMDVLQNKMCIVVQALHDLEK